jgi:hypothetical protein
MIFYIFSPKNLAKKLAFLTQNKAKLFKNLIITMVFEKNSNFFNRKLSKIAEKCGHNIGPMSDQDFVFFLGNILDKFFSFFAQTM